MAYEKNTWSDGDIITAEKLNHIEEGIAALYGEASSNESEGSGD